MKKKIFKILFIGVLLSIFSTLAFSNDWEFGSRGEHIIPLKSSEVAIKKEKITLKMVEEGVYVNVIFTFDSPIAENKIIGFVTPENYYEEEEIEVNPDLTLKDMKIENFKTKVNGKEVKSNVDFLKNILSKGIIDKNEVKKYESKKYIDSFVYYFDANFKKGENVVEHSYFYTGSYGIYERDFEYILTTISKWKGQKVEDFELILDIGTNFVRIPYSFWKNNKKVDWEVVGDGRIVFVEQKSENENLDAAFVKLKNGYVRYKAKDFAPDFDFFMVRMDDPLRASFILPKVAIQKYKFTDELLEDVAFSPDKEDLKRYSDKELDILRNYPYAAEGYDFTKKELKDYYSQFFWYMPLTKNVKIKEHHRNLIKNIDEIKAERAKKK